MELREGYKNTEVGVIPEDWEVKELGDFLKVIGGGAFKSRDSSQTGVKWLKIANVDINKTNWDDESFLPIELIKDNENFLLKEDDYVLALTRPILDRKLKIAKLNLQDVPALLNQRVGKIEVECQTNIDYTYYLFQKFETISGLLQSMAGTDPPNLSNKGIYGIKCGVPPTKTEQTAIATALSDADALINSLEKLIAKKRNIKQGAMQQLLKPKEGWKVKKLGDLTDMFSGGTPLTSNVTYYNGNIPWVVIADITKAGKYINETEKSISNEGLINSSAKLFEKGVLLFAMYASIGKTTIALMDTTCNQAILGIQPHSIDKEYLYYFLSFNERKFATMGQTGTQSNLSKDMVQKIEIPFPIKKEEQTRIATILSDMDAEIQALETKLEKYRKIKLGMMQNLLTGKIRLV